MTLLAVLKPGGDAATALYIVAFSLFIVGLKKGTHPTSAKQGNLIAAACITEGGAIKNERAAK